jgi:hypothetical protein
MRLRCQWQSLVSLVTPIPVASHINNTRRCFTHFVLSIDHRMTASKRMSQLDRLRGCLFGGALGDTIGLFTEFLSAQRSREIYGSQPVFTLTPYPSDDQNSPTSANPKPNLKWCHVDQHRAKFEPSAWTDDTDQTLLILLGFLRSGGKECDAMDFARRLHFWVQNGLKALDRPPLGLGRTVGGVVNSKGFLDDHFGVARQ